MNSQLHEGHLSSRHAGSGRALLAHPTLQAWVATEEMGEQSNLWLRGSPGAGKSFLCSAAIDYVSRTPQAICLHYFYRFDDQSGTGSGGEEGQGAAVRTAALLIHQLLRHFGGWTGE